MKYTILEVQQATLPMSEGKRENGNIYTVEFEADNGRNEVQQYFVSESQIEEDILSQAAEHFNTYIMQAEEEAKMQ